MRRSLALRGLAQQVSYSECSSVGLWLRLGWVYASRGLGRGERSRSQLLLATRGCAYEKASFEEWLRRNGIRSQTFTVEYDRGFGHSGFCEAYEMQWCWKEQGG